VCLCFPSSFVLVGLRFAQTESLRSASPPSALCLFLPPPSRSFLQVCACGGYGNAHPHIYLLFSPSSTEHLLILYFSRCRNPPKVHTRLIKDILAWEVNLTMARRSNWTEEQRQRERDADKIRRDSSTYDVFDENGCKIKSYSKRVSAVIWCNDHDGHTFLKVYLRDKHG
jgi:hypothetical protein